MVRSARNRVTGTVKRAVLGSVIAEVVVGVGGRDVVSAITRLPVEDVGAHAGDTVTAVIKATEVLLEK